MIHPYRPSVRVPLQLTILHRIEIVSTIVALNGSHKDVKNYRFDGSLTAILIHSSKNLSNTALMKFDIWVVID